MEKEYFQTPIGIFENKINGYEAKGTFNDKGIRGLGLKGMKVYDFGWQYGKYNLTGENLQLRLSLHATDPVLEDKLGTQASKGCVRVSSNMNKFLKSNNILDYFKTKNIENGRYVVVIFQ